MKSGMIAGIRIVSSQVDTAISFKSMHIRTRFNDLYGIIVAIVDDILIAAISP
jgi:hypothetical protein